MTRGVTVVVGLVLAFVALDVPTPVAVVIGGLILTVVAAARHQSRSARTEAPCYSRRRDG
jgi:hypothetical protein